MNIPVDTVVELLMANSIKWHNWYTVDYAEGIGFRLGASTKDELRTKVREYLLTLVPKPVLLSECEEYKGSSVNEPIMVYRVGKFAYRSEDNRWYGYADMCQVIQPVEVPHEAD